MATGVLKASVGGVWVPVTVAGAQGPTGPQGVTGVQGPAGATGATGPAGPTGPQGSSGPDEVWVGPSDPKPANSVIELWYDTDAVAVSSAIGLPAGGTVAGQVLTKQSSLDFDAVWSEPAIRRFTTLANRNSVWVNPAKGSIAIITNEAAPYTAVENMMTIWDGVAWQWVRAWGTPWGILKTAYNSGSVNTSTSGLTLLHTPMAFTFIGGRQYKLNWHFRAVARVDNADAPAGNNMFLFDGTTNTSWLDLWWTYRGQWQSLVGSVLFTDNQARSLALGFSSTNTPLTIYPSQTWIEDLGPVPP